MDGISIEPLNYWLFYLQFVVRDIKSILGGPEQKVAGIDWNFNSYGGEAVGYVICWVYANVIP